MKKKNTIHFKRWKGVVKGKCRLTKIHKKTDTYIGGDIMNNRLSELQQKLQANIHHATKIAEKNTTKNNLGQVVIKSDDEWMKEDYWDELYKRQCTKNN